MNNRKSEKDIATTYTGTIAGNDEARAGARLITRREAMLGGMLGGAVGALALARRAEGLQQHGSHKHETAEQHHKPAHSPKPVKPVPPVNPDRLGYTPVVVPNGSTLPWRMVDGVKVFHLVAHEIESHEFTPGLTVTAWGYNGSTPGPVIEAVEGDRVRIYVTNHLPAPTTVHWHGLSVPSGMDGVAGLSQPVIKPHETFKYEFTLKEHGTFMYHSHYDEMVQMGMGLMGMFVVHPRVPRTPKVDRDFAIMLSEWFVRPGSSRPDVNVMSDFNVLTMNSKVFPSTEPLVVQRGQRVRIRIGNLSAMDHHPMHLHGYRFKVTGTDGGPVPISAQWWETSVLVPVGNTRDIEWVADVSGDWAFHCHMTHHVMNQMGHDTPNMLGVNPGKSGRDGTDIDNRIRRLLPGYMTMGQQGMGGMHDMGMPVTPNSIPMKGGASQFGTIDMGGMFTIVKVRDRVTDYSEDAGWYDNPPGTVASIASDEDLKADGVI